MKGAILWLRNDLRLHDHGGFRLAEKSDAEFLIPVYILDEQELSPGTFTGLPRMGPFRAEFLRQTLDHLQKELQKRGSDLWIYTGSPAEVLKKLAEQTGADTLIYEQEETAFEKQREKEVRQTLPWLNHIIRRERTLIEDTSLPFDMAQMPDVFTEFRKKVEKHATMAAPFPAPEKLPPPSAQLAQTEITWEHMYPFGAPLSDPRTAFPFSGGEGEALKRLHDYLWERKLASSYKTTRNGLIGEAYSTKFSPWLANGSVSPGRIYAEVKQFENEFGPSDETYWIIFELLWRDYFRFVARKYGNLIFQSGGIRKKNKPASLLTKNRWEKWTNGQTGQAFCDAGMTELRLSGYLSNRMRQNCASYWCHDLNQPWQAGAEWFEHLLVDYDPCSNYGNWMYLAGVGNDPRPDRHFNLKLQAERYDRDGAYQKLWAGQCVPKGFPAFTA
jgi:deoxyribodipyrimidine photo-lyase